MRQVFKLFAWGCMGPSWLSVAPAQAEVPCQVAELSASDDPSGFGDSVAIDGDYIVVGAPGDQQEGAAYVFQRQGTSWVEMAKFTGSHVGLDDAFGNAVDIDGEYAVIGAPGQAFVSTGPGESYIFRRNDNTWTEEAYLLPSGSGDGDLFGLNVAIEGTTAVISQSGPASLAYVFEKVGGNWVETGVLNGDGGLIGGTGVGVSGDVIVVGNSYEATACPEDPLSCFSGAAYVFRRDGAAWVREAKLVPSDNEAGNHFGLTVAIDGDRILVGATKYNPGSARTGCVYVYERVSGAWQEITKLTIADATPVSELGIEVALQGGQAIVGTSNAGAFLFAGQGNNWGLIARFPLGFSVDLDGDYAVTVWQVHALTAIPPCIPAVSAWALAVLTLAIITLGTTRLRRISIPVMLLAIVCPGGGRCIYDPCLFGPSGP